MLALFLAVLSPIGVYGERFFFMHMIQHLLLLLIAPPLLLLGAPLVPSLWGLPTGARQAVGRHLAPSCPLARLGHVVTQPLVAVAAYVVTIALWHVPVVFDAAQGPTLVHDLQHMMFFGTALLYWWPIIHPAGGRRRLSYTLYPLSPLPGAAFPRGHADRRPDHPFRSPHLPYVRGHGADVGALRPQ